MSSHSVNANRGLSLETDVTSVHRVLHDLTNALEENGAAFNGNGTLKMPPHDSSHAIHSSTSFSDYSVAYPKVSTSFPTYFYVSPSITGANNDHNKENSDTSLKNKVILLDVSHTPLLCGSCTTPTPISKDGPDSRASNYVYGILMETGEGEFLMKSFDFERIPENYKFLLETKKQSYFSVHTVARLVVFHEIRRTNSYFIKPERFEELAKSAAILFPGVLKETFYSRSTPNSSAHGAYQTFYSRLREKAIAIKDLKISVSRKRKSNNNGIDYSNDFEELRKPVQIIDDEYKQKWRITATQEKLDFFIKSDIRTILSHFPNFCNPIGYTLIQEDFCAFFQKPADLFSTNWPAIATKIVRLAKSKTDKEIARIFKDNAACTINGGNHHALALILLPFLFRKITKQTNRSKTGKSWNPEKSVVLSTFIYHLKETQSVCDSLHEIRLQLQELHSTQKLTLQPYVVIVGPSLDQISSAFVILNDHTVQLATVTAAVDICFQSVKVFHEKFPNVCNHVWQFIERKVYGFDVNNLFTCVSKVINDMERL